MATQKIDSSQVTYGNRCYVYRDTNFALPAGAWQDILYDKTDYDIGDMHDAAVDSRHVYIKESGIYSIGAQARFNSRTDGGLKIKRFNSGGTQILGGVMEFGAGKDILNVSKTVYLNAGDYLDVQAFAFAATTITANRSGVADLETNCSFWVIMVGK